MSTMRMSPGNGVRVKKLREFHGLTQAVVAKEAGLHQSDVSDVESGRRTSAELVNRVIGGVVRSTSPSRVVRMHGRTMRNYLESEGISDIMLFGSTAQGEDRWNSDIDILAKMPPGTSLFELVDWEENLRRLTGGLRVDLVPDTPRARRRLSTSESEMIPL